MRSTVLRALAQSRRREIHRLSGVVNQALAIDRAMRDYSDLHPRQTEPDAESIEVLVDRLVADLGVDLTSGSIKAAPVGPVADERAWRHWVKNSKRRGRSVRNSHSLRCQEGFGPNEPPGARLYFQ